MGRCGHGKIMHVSWISRKYSWDCLLIIIACQVSEYDAIFSWLLPCHDGITDGTLEHLLNMNPAAYPLVTLGNGSQLVGLEDEAASGKLDGLPERTGGFSTKNSRDHPNMWSFPWVYMTLPSKLWDFLGFFTGSSRMSTWRPSRRRRRGQARRWLWRRLRRVWRCRWSCPLGDEERGIVQ